ncbi:MAG: FAD-binding oxidoreductase [Deltaproteobacteria bacterium]|nr:FAD-binding oxidoreductase [Deltaproteobacteria bacterium]
MTNEEIKSGTMHLDNVAPDSLEGIPRQCINPPRWHPKSTDDAKKAGQDDWRAFVEELEEAGLTIDESHAACAIFVTDAGGLSYGMPHGVLRPQCVEDISKVLKAAQRHHVPVTVRGGGLGTEGEAVAFGGLLLDMSSMQRVIDIDKTKMTARVEGGIFWHELAEVLRREGLDYLSAPLNFTSTVGGVLGVGGVDINSPKYGLSADQAIALKVVTPTGDVVECTSTENSDLFERVILGYGQFGVIAEATLKIRNFTPMKMRYLYYSNLRSAIEDLRTIVESEASDYSGILTIMDRAITLLVGFDSKEREKEFIAKTEPKLRGHGEVGFGLRMAVYYAFRPWKLGESFYLLKRRLTLFPDLQRREFMDKGEVVDRSVIFSRAVWRHWGSKKMTIPDLSAPEDKFIEAVERGNAVCRKYFKYYTLYCVGIKKKPEANDEHYEMSCVSKDAVNFAYGCEFEPSCNDGKYSRDQLQSFKNEIYDIGVDMNLSCYRFGGMMKGYIRRLFGDEVVDRQLKMKREADPAMILNPNTVF